MPTIRNWEYKLAAIAFSIGLVMVITTYGAPFSKTEAAATPYTSTWDASELIGAQLEGHGFPYDIPIGVAQWQVKGGYSGASFKETWNTPGGPAMQVTASTGTLDSGGSYRHDGIQFQNKVSFDPNQWLVAIPYEAPINNKEPTYHFYIDTPANFAKKYASTSQNHANGGSGASCNFLTGGITCMLATGSYGFGFNESGHQQAGSINYIPNTEFLPNSFAPLHWDITGTYCDSPTDTACQ